MYVVFRGKSVIGVAFEHMEAVELATRYEFQFNKPGGLDYKILKLKRSKYIADLQNRCANCDCCERIM